MFKPSAEPLKIMGKDEVSTDCYCYSCYGCDTCDTCDCDFTCLTSCFCFCFCFY